MLFLLLICFLLGVATGNQYTRAVYPMIIEERTEDGTVVLHVHDGLSLSLTKAKVATEALRLRSRIDGREIDQIVNGTEIERNLFEDRQKMATVSLIKASDGVRVSGLLSPSERIETAFYDARQASGRIPHIVRNIQRPFGSRPLSMDRRKDLFIRRCHESYLPGNITIEVYVVSDVIHNRRFTEEDLLIYICVFMNSINAIFMSLTCPSVRVALVGLEKSDQSDEYGYVYGSENLMNMYSLYTFKDYVRKRMHKYGNPDVVLLLTGRDVYESVNGGISRDITGIAFEGGVCTDSCVALAEDVPGSFSGITDAAHELGHSLGASHDGTPPNQYIRGHPGSSKCPGQSGYLMTYVDGGHLRYKFSKCNQEEIRYVLSLRGQKCWNINADVFFSVKDVYPGALINPTDFCRRFYKNNEVYSPREPFVRSHCKMRCCAVLRPNTLTCSLHHMLDHTWCDYGKKCFQGVCTGGENSSPYQSKKFSRKH
uniref:Reprolysin n=1 Tax=Rhipicephalus zambeziensis TaxID=60191 RepID=A0A224YE99_9ACAR